MIGKIAEVRSQLTDLQWMCTRREVLINELKRDLSSSKQRYQELTKRCEVVQEEMNRVKKENDSLRKLNNQLIKNIHAMRSNPCGEEEK